MSSDPRDYKLEISGQDAEPEAANDASSAFRARPWLSVMFECCNAYQRVYRSPDGAYYEGRCPRCAGRVRFVIGPGGTGARSFRVS